MRFQPVRMPARQPLQRRKCTFNAAQTNGIKCGAVSICASKSCNDGNCESSVVAKDGTPCGYNEAPCKVNVCSVGTCTAVDAVDGTSCPAPADDKCAQSGQCKTGKCVQKTPVADGTVCGDETTCGEAPTCKAGKCVGQNKADDVPCAPKWPNACATSACELGKCEPKVKKPNGSLCDVFGPKPKECTVSPTCVDGQCTGPIVKVPEGAPCEPDNSFNMSPSVCSTSRVCQAGACVSGGGPLVDMTGRACDHFLAVNLWSGEPAPCSYGFCDGKGCAPIANNSADGVGCVTQSCAINPGKQHCKSGGCQNDPCPEAPGVCYQIVQAQCGGCYDNFSDWYQAGKPCIGNKKGPCFTSGSCDGWGGCKQYEIFGGPCDDGDPKTKNDHCCGLNDKGCQFGTCVGN